MTNNVSLTTFAVSYLIPDMINAPVWFLFLIVHLNRPNPMQMFYSVVLCRIKFNNLMDYVFERLVPEDIFLRNLHGLIIYILSP